MVIIMSKLLRKDVEKWNSECSNGFKFDIQYFIFHNEKTLEKDIVLDDENFLKAHLSFYAKYENFKEVGYYINLNVSKYYHKKGDNFSSSNGLGVNLQINDTIYTKRSFKELQKATATITDDVILALAENKQIDNARIL